MVGGGVMAIIGWGVTMELGEEGRERGRRRNGKSDASIETRRTSSDVVMLYK